jgi:hypothetical protein
LTTLRLIHLAARKSFALTAINTCATTSSNVHSTVAVDGGAAGVTRRWSSERRILVEKMSLMSSQGCKDGRDVLVAKISRIKLRDAII